MIIIKMKILALRLLYCRDYHNRYYYQNIHKLFCPSFPIIAILRMPPLLLSFVTTITESFIIILIVAIIKILDNLIAIILTSAKMNLFLNLLCPLPTPSAGGWTESPSSGAALIWNSSTATSIYIYPVFFISFICNSSVSSFLQHMIRSVSSPTDTDIDTISRTAPPLASPRLVCLTPAAALAH